MTPESIQAMIDRAIQRKSTHNQDDGSQSSGVGLERPMQPARAVLTWWNGHVRTSGHDAAYAMTWGTLKKKLMDKYCLKGSCYECGNTGHIKRNCPTLKNRRNGNGNGIAQGRAYALGGRDASSDSNIITENHYDVELADGKIIGVNTIIRGCTLNFMNHPFNIDLMHVLLGSFDVIIMMDWLTKYHGVIICDEKIVRVPFRRKMLIFQGDGKNQREESRLNIISCTKAQKYLSKGCDVFLAHITTKEAKDKSKGRRLKDVPIVRDFPEVFLEDLSGPRLEYHLTLTIGMRLLFNCLISRSTTSIGSSTKWSLSSTCSSSNGITSDSSDRHLDTAFDLDDLLSGFMNYCRTSKLSISNFCPIHRRIPLTVNVYPNPFQNLTRKRVTCLPKFGWSFHFDRQFGDDMSYSCPFEFLKPYEVLSRIVT
nr:hypothetical protein [Tanacetum cinerariifolium]